jgi:hypothetical protein
MDFLSNQKTKIMKLILFATFLYLPLHLLFATELEYKWKANTSYTFASIQKDDVTTSAMGMNIQEKFTTTVDFVLFIQSVDLNGLAKGKLFLVNYSVKDSKGVVLANLASLPKNAVQSDITVDKKGHFTFPKKVSLVTTPNGNYLIYAKSDQNSASAGVQTSDEKVDVYAEFDPKTGKLKAGYTVQSINSTKKVVVKENEESDHLDVFPYDYLEMMVLPDGKVAQGDTYKMSAGMYNVDIAVKSMANGIATLDEKISTSKNADMFQGSASGQTEEGSFEMSGFGGVDEMELDAEDQAAMDMTKGMAPEMNGTITSNFDYVNGMFVSIGGTLTTVVDMMGMKMIVKSVLEMKKK